MKLITRISKEEIQAQSETIVSAIRTQVDDKTAREYIEAVMLEEIERIANHAFSEGRLFERRNPNAS
jgi:hypothetical protein